jgi:hypothetical protein
MTIGQLVEKCLNLTSIPLLKRIPSPPFLKKVKNDGEQNNKSKLRE